MSIKVEIERDLKRALIGGDKETALSIKSIKSAILDLEIEKGLRDSGLPDEEVVALLRKESKKRKDTAEIYAKSGDVEREAKELAEVELIDGYLPKLATEEETLKVVNGVIGHKDVSVKDMGRLIAETKKILGSSADGAVIARIIKERISE